MKRRSILFNPTDFCLIIFSGGSQQTWQIKRSCYKGGSMFIFVLCCSEHLEGLVIASDENVLRLFFLGICKDLLQLLFFFHQQPSLGRAFFVPVQYQSTMLKRCHLTQSKDVQTREVNLRIFKASATSQKSKSRLAWA